MTELVRRIFGTQVLLSPELWILGVMLSLNPGVRKVRETAYPELGPAWIFLHLT